MNASKFIPSGGGSPTNVLGTGFLIKVRGGDTNGILSVAESTDQPGGGTPPHIHHREDETFFVLEGEYEFTCAGKKISAKKGDTVFAPRDIPHNYTNVGKTTGRMLVTMTPAGFEKFFEEVNGVTDIGRIVEVGGKYGMEVLTPQ